MTSKYDELKGLITKGRWNDVKKIIQKKSIDIEQGIPCNCTGRHSVLHFAAYNRPPKQIIKILFAKYPDAINETDCLGYYPLHVAIENGAPLKVITYLTKRNIKAIEKTTSNGDNALHLVLASSRPKAELLEIIHLICKISPSLIHLPNKFAVSPYMLANVKRFSSDICEAFDEYNFDQKKLLPFPEPNLTINQAA